MQKNYRGFWNDEDIERSKPFYIEDKDDLKLIRYLREETNLQRCFMAGLDFAEGLVNGLRGRVLDIGAGVAWTSALVSRLPSVTNVVAVDYSKHRLSKIAPIVFEQLSNDNISKFDSVLGDFMDLEFDTEFDVILFCQSSYMFKDLNALMNKVKVLLAVGGILMVACERIAETYSIFSPKLYRRKLAHILRGRVDTSGNHFYNDKEYKNAIEKSGLEYHFQMLNYPVYLSGNLMAGNHFGIKN